MAQRVVDVFEMVDIQQDEGSEDVQLLSLLQCHLQLLEHGSAVE